MATKEERSQKTAELQNLISQANAAGDTILAKKYTEELYALSFDVLTETREEAREGKKQVTTEREAFEAATPQREAGKAIQASAEAARNRKRAVAGSSSTILTSPLGVTGKALTKKKKLLGE